MKTKRGVASHMGASAGQFSRHSGPIVSSPKVYAIYVGEHWMDISRLNSFLSDLLNSSIMKLLSQYGVGTGVFLGGVIVRGVSGIFSDASIRWVIQTKLLDAGTVPEPDGNQVLMLFLDDTLEVSDAGLGIVMCEPQGDTAFGYHDFFITKKGNPCYYSVVPALTDQCVQESCPSGGCTLSLSDTQEQRVTEVATHEFGEMVTDPQLSAWTDTNGNEIGDVCGGQNSTITVGGRSWKVQKLWDNQANTCGDGTPPKMGSGNAIVFIANLLAYKLAFK